MAKQKIRAVDQDQLPDHVLETIISVAEKIDDLTRPLCQEISFSVFINAITFFFACKIIANVDKENRKEYAQGLADSLVKTVKNFSKEIID